MESSHTVNLSNDDAFVAFSNPNEDDFLLHLCDHVFAGLSDKNLNEYDFVSMPFVSDPLLNSFFKYKETFINQDFSFFSKHTKVFNITSKTDYFSDVTELVNAFKVSELNKAVYSRKIKIENPSLDMGEVFRKLRLKYPKAFTFIYNIPKIGCWVGATPELLLKKEGDSLITVALAGTQKLFKGVDNVIWGQKEVDEQAYIKSFVKNILTEQGLSFNESATSTKKAGDVCHIFTEFKLDIPNSIAKLIKDLHPGPAISGSPKEMAIECILALEKHKRSFYTGFLGEIKEEKLNLYINLRSMEVLEQCFLLYVGGGITVDSRVEDEWTETELKSNTMSSVIK